jgi:hypothetical protein
VQLDRCEARAKRHRSSSMKIAAYAGSLRSRGWTLGLRST